MHIQEGKFGGPDVSSATETAQCIKNDATGLNKITVSGAPNEFKLLKISDVHKVGKWFGIEQVQKSNAIFGICDAKGNLHPHAVSASQGGQVAAYNPTVRPNDDLAHWDKYDHIRIGVGSDGQPATYLYQPGPAL